MIRLLILVSLVSSCSFKSTNEPLDYSTNSQKSYPIKEQEVQGWINNYYWKIVMGHLIQVEDSGGNPMLKLQLFAEPITLCSPVAWGTAKEPVISATVTGLNQVYNGYEPSLNVIGSHVTDNMTLLPNEVTIELLGVADGYLTGGLGAGMEGQVDISGKFSVIDCRGKAL